jgi:acyl-CoA thioesterase-1
VWTFSVQDDTDVAVVALGRQRHAAGHRPRPRARQPDAIVRKLKARGMTVVLAGMMGRRSSAATRRTFNRIYPDLAEKHGTYLYPFLLNGVALVERYNQRDGIHPMRGGALIAKRSLRSWRRRSDGSRVVRSVATAG